MKEWMVFVLLGVLVLLALVPLSWLLRGELLSQHDQPKLELTIASSNLRGEKK